jgi:Tfp pilus assembly protein PilV
MRTFLTQTRPHRGRSTERSRRHRLRRLRRALAPRNAQVASQDGFMLIEVIASAVMLAVIVVGTFSAFEVVDRSSTNSRSRGEAALLANESQENLRSLPASALNQLTQAGSHYTRTVGHTTYTVNQSANFTGAGEASASCNATETSRQSANAVRITSKVEWSELTGKHSLTESGVVTPPTGSALEIDVANGAPGTLGVAGIAAKLKYVAAGTHAESSLQGTTNSGGCVIFGGIPATAATVEIPEETGFVIPDGTLKVPTKEVEIAPNFTQHDLVAFDRGGQIKATFTHNGEEIFEGKRVEGDTFVVANKSMNALPDYEVGGTNLTYKAGGEETATVLPSLFKATALTAAAPKYNTGNLFPFPEPKWEVYAGDCPENDPASLTGHTVSPAETIVASGTATTVKVPLSLVSLNVYTGAGPKSPPTHTLSSTRYEVAITNLKCAGTTPNNETAINTKHIQASSTSGHLEDPFQPFGEFELCLATGSRLDKVSYSNITAAGSAPVIYVGQRTSAELAAQKASEESTFTKRESEEATLTKAQATEEANRKAIETTEANERAAWLAEEKAKFGKKLTKAERVKLEAAQTAARKTREATEAANKTTRAGEETKLHARKATEEAAKTARAKEESEASETKVRVEAGSKC